MRCGVIIRKVFRSDGLEIETGSQIDSLLLTHGAQSCIKVVDRYLVSSAYTLFEPGVVDSSHLQYFVACLLSFVSFSNKCVYASGSSQEFVEIVPWVGYQSIPMEAGQRDILPALVLSGTTAIAWPGP